MGHASDACGSLLLDGDAHGTAMMQLLSLDPVLQGHDDEAAALAWHIFLLFSSQEVDETHMYPRVGRRWPPRLCDRLVPLICNIRLRCRSPTAHP
jgi:hypothetical protein